VFDSDAESVPLQQGQDEGGQWAAFIIAPDCLPVFELGRIEQAGGLQISSHPQAASFKLELTIFLPNANQSNSC
jgi:hypothetical protein